MTARFATTDETASWDERVLKNPDEGNVFQSLEFAEQKRHTGWTPRFVVCGDYAVTVLEKSVPLLGKLWYTPKGPGVSTTRELSSVLDELAVFARDQGVFCLKVEPELRKADETAADLLKLGLTRVRPIQPNFSTITLDLRPSLDEILGNLNQKGRHAIRRAERDGVVVQQVESTDENCRTMYDLLAETAAGSFGIRDFNYYRGFWQRFTEAGLGQLFFAYVDGKVVAGAYAIAFGHKGTYKDGASVRERSVYGASHLLQWHIITWMKSRGVQIHDLCGSPPSDQIDNPKHPHYGIYRFKSSFNKEVTDYVGAYDLPLRPRQYAIWSRYGERLALRHSQAVKHESYY